MVNAISLLLAAVLGLANSYPAEDVPVGLSNEEVNKLNKAYTEAYGNEIAHKTDFTGAAQKAVNHMATKISSPKKKCDDQCAKTGTACSAACLANLLALNVGNVAPCFAACGTASAACHNACTQAEADAEKEES